METVRYLADARLGKLHHMHPNASAFARRGQLWEDRQKVVAAFVSSKANSVTAAVVAGELFFTETLWYLVKFVPGTRVTCSKQINRKGIVLSRSR